MTRTRTRGTRPGARGGLIALTVGLLVLGLLAPSAGGAPGDAAPAAPGGSTPANDDFAGAQPLEGERGQSRGTTAGASVEYGEPNRLQQASHSVWFSWRAPADGSYRFGTVGEALDTVLGIHTGNAVDGLETVGVNDDNGDPTDAAITFDATAGTTYHVQVDGVDGQTGPFVLTWDPVGTVAAASGADNDDFADAAPMTDAQGTVTGSTADATVELDEDDPWTDGSSSIWWTWTSPADGYVTFDTAGSSFDTTLAIHTGDTLDTLLLEAASDDARGAATSRITYLADAGRTYHLRVDGRDGATGDVVLTWGPAADQAVTASPATGPAAGVVVGPVGPVLGNSSGAVLDRMMGLFRDDAPEVTTVQASTHYDPIPTSGGTADKPQSKVWRHDGSWFAVLSTTESTIEGTWVWRLDEGQGWAPVTQLSISTTARADVVHRGSVVHVLLWESSTTANLWSLQYAGSGAWDPWTDRTTATTITLNESESATIAVDSDDRMWLAADTPNTVEVFNSASPYTDFGTSQTLETGIDADDAVVVTRVGGDQIGVAWSNTDAERFGFRIRGDSDGLTSWGANEVPAGDQALTNGDGQADDHLNAAVGPDGILYLAAKTGYSSAGFPVMALLERAPDGTWTLHNVDDNGTRPIVVYGEDDERVRFLYNVELCSSNIVMKTAPAGYLDFSAEPETVLSGGFCDVTSTKATYTDEVVVMATDGGETQHTTITALPPPSLTAKPGSLVVPQNTPTDGQLEAFNPDEHALTYSIVTQGTQGTATINDAATGTYTYTPDPDVIGSDSFTFEVSGGGDTSQATVSVEIEPDTWPEPRGMWHMEDGGGSQVTDSSGIGNHGTITGEVQWVTRGGGLALQMTSDDNVLVPDSNSLDLTTAITMAGWVRPANHDTQYVIRKGNQGGANGYELSISSSGVPFVRFNQSASGNTYRVNGTQALPLNEWTHLAATFDGTTTRLYVDGVEVATGSGPGTGIAENTEPLGLGNQSNGARGFDGALDELHLYGRALTFDEIRALAMPPDAVQCTENTAMWHVFSDVSADHPFCVDIAWMAQEGVSTGFNDGTYRPGVDVTRMAMSAFMARLAGASTPACATPPFSDVPVDHPFCAEIKWMADAGISNGYKDGTYRPGVDVTRMAMSAFMTRLAGATPPGCTEPPFPDVPMDHPFCAEIAWMADNGISNGYDDGTYRPGVDVTRMAMSAFMKRLSELP